MIQGAHVIGFVVGLIIGTFIRVVGNQRKCEDDHGARRVGFNPPPPPGMIRPAPPPPPPPKRGADYTHKVTF